MPLGLYISLPFCRSKCSYCNFASNVFSRSVFEGYLDRVCSDMQRATDDFKQMGRIDRGVDSVYLGGGTPTLLDISQLERLFVTISQNFDLRRDAEITMECAPGTLTPAMIEAIRRFGVNRASLGVQSLIDREAAAVGRLHTRETVLKDLEALRAAGITNLNIDLIAGLPHQTAESWQTSLAEVIASGVPHVSVYMLEIDEESRLGRELIAGGTRYHAHFVPDEDLTADSYLMACNQLQAAGVEQYEISNFARKGCESRHNLKYWTRQPYLGFGVDAHSMLEANPEAGGPDSLHAIRFATPDSLEAYLTGAPFQVTPVPQQAALEETFFLGLRLARGVDLGEVAAKFGDLAVARFSELIQTFVEAGLLEWQSNVIRLTPRGRLLSNEVFEQLISTAATAEPKV